MDEVRACRFLNCSREEIEDLVIKESLDSLEVLRWSKLLEYDFFRIYSHHLILYAPPGSDSGKKTSSQKSSLPQFRKNIYTKEIIAFILERIDKKEMTVSQVIKEYRIPKTTIHRWLAKYKKNNK